jgi:hypothetical protein
LSGESNVPLDTPIAESTPHFPFAAALARLREHCKQVQALCAYAAERHAITITSVASTRARVSIAPSIVLLPIRERGATPIESF